MQSVNISPKVAVHLLYYLCVAQIILWAWLKGNGILFFVFQFALTPVIMIVVMRVFYAVLKFDVPQQPDWGVLASFLLLWVVATIGTLYLPFAASLLSPKLGGVIPPPALESLWDSLLKPIAPLAPVFCIVGMHRQFKVLGIGGLFNRKK